LMYRDFSKAENPAFDTESNIRHEPFRRIDMLQLPMYAYFAFLLPFRIATKNHKSDHLCVVLKN